MATSIAPRRVPPFAGLLAGLAVLLVGGIAAAPRVEADGRPDLCEFIEDSEVAPPGDELCVITRPAPGFFQ